MPRATPYNIPPQEQKTPGQVWEDTASLGKAVAGGALKGTGDVLGFIPRAGNLVGGYAGIVDDNQFLENEQSISNAINWTPDALGLRPDMEANPNASSVGEIIAPIGSAFKVAKRGYNMLNPVNKNTVLSGASRGTDTVQAGQNRYATPEQIAEHQASRGMYKEPPMTIDADRVPDVRATERYDNPLPQYTEKPQIPYNVNEGNQGMHSVRAASPEAQRLRMELGTTRSQLGNRTPASRPMTGQANINNMRMRELDIDNTGLPYASEG